MIDTIAELFHRGGWVMYPLVVLSIVALTFIFERFWFWWRTNNLRSYARYQRVARHLRAGEHDEAHQLVDNDRSVYGRLVQSMLAENASDAVVTEAVENQRPRMERFMPTLNTIISAAPMFGILGTVTGIIASFKVLSESDMITDPSKLGGGIAEALLTTVVGLVVALVVLFPYNAYRAQIDRTLGRMEALVAAYRTGVAE